jgi:hypothetical protein
LINATINNYSNKLFIFTYYRNPEKDNTPKTAGQNRDPVMSDYELDTYVQTVSHLSL